MAKRRHEPEQTSSKATLVGMGAAGLAVAALVVWALTRTVQPAPAATTEVPMVVEQPNAVPTNTLPPLDATQTGIQPAETSTYRPNPPSPDENASVKRISVTDLRAKVDAKQVTVIDVRDKTAFITSHIPGSLHVPMATVESQVTFLPKDKPIVTYCT